MIDDDAASLWTFDGDAFDSGSRKLLVPQGDPNYILDEIDNLNPAILHCDHDLYLGYRLGLPSLCVFEQTDQHCISFGFYGQQPSHPNQWGKAYLEIPHTSSYAFPHYGSFSVEFLFNKEFGIDAGTSISPTRPIISKAGVFNIYFSFPQFGTAQIVVSHPGGTNTTVIPLYNFKSSYNLINSTVHFVLTWEVKPEGGGNYKGTASVYINSYLASQQTYTYLDTFPNTNIANPILIAGNAGSNRNTDWHTSNFMIDQIAIYDRVLNVDEVANHFSKVFPYDEMIKREFSSNFWPFDDTDSVIDFSIHPSVGNFNGTYVGTRGTHFQRNVTGPPNLLGSTAASFTNGGMASFIALGNFGAYSPRQINSEYTYEFWFKGTPLKRSFLLGAQELTYPFDGPLVQLNMRDNQEVIGCLQFTEGSDGTVLNSRYLNDAGNRFLYNDGNWHHIVILRRSTSYIELWLDGILHATSLEPTRTVGQPGQLLLMNSLPGQIYTNGSLSKLSYYSYALQEHQIRNHYSYTITYLIRGIVTLLGVPYQATLRFYNSHTGEFIQELTSDPNTGEYQAVFYNNANIDILVFSASDLSVRYRAYGPVTPSEYIDLPIQV